MILLCVACSSGINTEDKNNITSTGNQDTQMMGLSSSSIVPDGAICSVNGEYIFDIEITSIYEQFDGEYSYNKILDDSIIELLVVQKAPEYGFTVSDDEIQSAVLAYKTNFPTFYESALEVNTEKQFQSKLKTTLLFEKVKDYVCHNIISNKENITQTELLSFKQSCGLIDHLDEYNDETVIISLWSDIQNYLFLEWANGLKPSAEIIYYAPNDTDSMFQFNQLSSKFSTEVNRLYFDPETTYKETWTFDEAVSYFGRDFRPSYIPDGLNSIMDYEDDFRFTVLNNINGSIAYDVLMLNYENDFKSNEPLEKALTLQVSKQEIWTDAPVTNETGETKSIIDGTEVVLAEKQLPYGPYLDSSDGTKIPSGYYTMLVAQFYHENIYYRITSKNIDRNEFIKILYSIIQCDSSN